MNWMLLLVKLLPTIVNLMGLAEKVLGPKAGEQKKELVMGAAQAIIGGVAAVSTGGQADTWDRIKDPVSQIVDSAAAIAFPHNEIG